MSIEIWKDVVGYDGLYKVSESGSVKSTLAVVKCKNYFRIRPSKLLSQHISRCGYSRVTLFKNGFRKVELVHRLVAQAFHPLSEFLGAEVNHRDGMKSNNHFRNLEWVTSGENQKHAYRLGLKSKKHLMGGANFKKKQLR